VNKPQMHDISHMRGPINAGFWLAVSIDFDLDKC